METALGKRLDEEELRKLGRQMVARYGALRQGMEAEFLPKRAKFKLFSEGDYSARATTDGASIYSKSNIPLEFINGVADFMVARTCEDIFGSDPYFSVIPQGPADKLLSEQLPKHMGHKLGEARFKTVGRQAVRRGYHLGEGVLKTTWRRDVDASEELSVVLCDGGGAEVTDENGDFIFLSDYNLGDLWAKSPMALPEDGQAFALMPDVSPMAVLCDKDGVPVKGAKGEYWFEADLQTLAGPDGKPAGQVYCKSPVVSKMPEDTFEERLIEDMKVIFEGLDVGLVEAGDFVAPLNVRHLSEADGIFHRLSLRRSELRDRYEMSEEVEAAIGEPDARPKNDAKKPQSGEGEAGLDPEDEDPEYECLECYARLEVAGKMRRVFALVERQSETVIACDYWANVVPGAATPFSAIVPCPVPGRWHGRGYHEIYEGQGDFIDRTFNAIIYRNKIHATPPMFIRDQAFKDASVAKNFLITPDKAYHLNNDYTAAQAVQFPDFPDLDSRTWQILELVMQMAQVRSGVTGAAQGAVTNLPANGTATGVQSIMMSGSVLHKLPIECVKDGLEDTLNITAVVLYANQNKDETFAYLEGDATELITLNAGNVQGLKLNIRLLMTRLHERESLESAKAAIEAVMQYVSNVAEAEKDQVRPLFIQVLKALRITGADAILRHALPPEPQGAPPQSERFTETLNYKDAPEDIRRQMEVAAGYQPSALPPVDDEKAEGKEAPEPPEPPEVPTQESVAPLPVAP